MSAPLEGIKIIGLRRLLPGAFCSMIILADLGTLARLGVGYEESKKVNPGIIFCAISGYGQNGPYKDIVGHDINYLGIAGILSITGSPDGTPVIPGVQIGDIRGGSLMAAIAILAAIIAREKTKKGYLRQEIITRF